MAETDTAATPPPARPRPRSGWRWAAWMLAIVGAMVLAAAGAVAWLGSESGLQWLAARTPLRLGTTQIVLKDVQGSLWSSVRIGQLQLITADTTTTLIQARLHWTPAELWHRRLHLQSFSVQRIAIEQTHAAPAKSPPQPPASLRLPLRVDLDRFDIGSLQIGPPGALQPYGSLRGTLHYDRAHYRAQIDADTPWARAQLQAQLGDTAPYALQATLNATRIGVAGQAAATNTADLHADGNLRNLSLSGSLRMGAAHASLQPASPRSTPRHCAARGWSPKRWTQAPSAPPCPVPRSTCSSTSAPPARSGFRGGCRCATPCPARSTSTACP